MADTRRTGPERAGDTRESEHDAIRSSNDRDQKAEREGVETEHNRGYDEAALRAWLERIAASGWSDSS